MTILLRSLLLSPLLATGLAGCVAQPIEPESDTRAALTEPVASRDCLLTTRRPVSGDCRTRHAIVVTREELERSGGATLSESLQRRVPSLY